MVRVNRHNVRDVESPGRQFDPAAADISGVDSGPCGADFDLVVYPVANIISDRFDPVAGVTRGDQVGGFDRAGERVRFDSRGSNIGWHRRRRGSVPFSGRIAAAGPCDS